MPGIPFRGVLQSEGGGDVHELSHHGQARARADRQLVSSEVAVDDGVIELHHAGLSGHGETRDSDGCFESLAGLSVFGIEPEHLFQHLVAEASLLFELLYGIAHAEEVFDTDSAEDRDAKRSEQEERGFDQAVGRSMQLPERDDCDIDEPPGGTERRQTAARDHDTRKEGKNGDAQEPRQRVVVAQDNDAELDRDRGDDHEKRDDAGFQRQRGTIASR